jgi:hypothetical protein
MAQNNQQVLPQTEFAVLAELDERRTILQEEIATIDQARATQIQRLQNIPAFDQGAAIIEALGRMEERMNRRFDHIDRRLERIENRLDN